jgi:RND family efflux transporter MFP subunit
MPTDFMKNFFSRLQKMKWPMLLVLAALVAIGGTACRKESASKPPDVDYYTCTMHPSVRKQSPTDKCPICSMDLEPVKKKGAPTAHDHGNAKGDAKSMGMSAEEHANMHSAKSEMKGMPGMPGMEGAKKEGAEEEQPTEFTVPTKRLQQIGVTYETVEKKKFQHTVRAVGLVAYDKQRHWDYVARIEGYVQKLFVFSRGEVVEKDAPILTIYSPDLLTTQNEFVNLLKMRDDAREKGSKAVLDSTERLVESAKQRLRLWNISDAQVAELGKTLKPQEYLTLYSPFRGVIQDIGVDQGRKVMNGDHLVDIADLSVIWVWAQFYQDELPMLKKGLPMTITTSSYPGEKFTGKISVIDPFINETMRTGRVRLDVENPDFKLQPEMYVDVEFSMDMGEGIAVPVSAVLPTGKRNVAFVDKGEGKLEPRFLELGRKYGDSYEVKSGVAEGERLVTSGNFLIDAEAKVQGALKSW